MILWILAGVMLGSVVAAVAILGYMTSAFTMREDIKVFEARRRERRQG